MRVSVPETSRGRLLSTSPGVSLAGGAWPSSPVTCCMMGKIESIKELEATSGDGILLGVNSRVGEAFIETNGRGVCSSALRIFSPDCWWYRAARGVPWHQELSLAERTHRGGHDWHMTSRGHRVHLHPGRADEPIHGIPMSRMRMPGLQSVVSQTRPSFAQ